MLRIKALTGLFVLFLVSSAHADTWTPIIGIPAPPFGITENSPTLPANWNSDVSGFYYVCPSCAGSGNSSLGNPSSPRNDMPNSISSGDVIVIAGDISGGSFSYACTSAAPCFVLGDATNAPVMSGESSFSGSYVIIDGLSATLPSQASGSTMGLHGDHMSFRNGSISGNLSSGGAGTNGDFIVFFNNDISDNGDVNASNDQDRHGIKVSGRDVWIIGNQFSRNSGDGVQVGDIGTRASVSNIYIGGNTAFNNKQTGFWVKEAENVIVSQNLAYDHVASGSSSGEGFGGQYDGRNIWFIFNEARNNQGGIGFKSSNNGGGSNFFVVGNLIRDNVSSRHDPSDAWSIASIASWNSADITIVNNTVTGNSGGINLNGNTGSAYVYNNVITGMQNSSAKAINAADPSDIQYQDANALDGQEIIDAGVVPFGAKDPYAIFQSQYGRSILVDFDGRIRPIREWDIGAFESQDAAGAKPNAPVLTVEP